MRTCPETLLFFVSLSCKLDGHPKLFSFYLLNYEDKVELEKLLHEKENWTLYDIDWCPRKLSLPRNKIIIQIIEDKETCQAFYHIHGCFFGNCDLKQILTYPPPKSTKKKHFFIQWKKSPKIDNEIEEKAKIYQEHFSEISPKKVTETLQSLKIFFKKNKE
jgi:hypothetical protein